MSIRQPSHRQWLWLGLALGHLVLPVGLWTAIRIGRPRFVGLALYLVIGVLFVDLLLYLGSSSKPIPLDHALDARVPTILLLASTGLVALLGPGPLFYLGVTATLVSVLTRALSRRAAESSGVVNLAVVCATSALVIGAEVFTVAYYVSVPDNVNHTTTAIVLMNEGWLSAISATRYFLFSAFHVLTSTGMTFTQLEPQLLVGVLMIALFQVALVSVYLFFENWSQSRPLALIATVFVSINISFLHYGSVAHYQSMSFVLFCVFLAMLARGRWAVRDVALATPLVATWIVTHHVTVLMVIVLLAVPIGYLAIQIWRRDRQTDARPTVFMFTSFCLMFGVYWTIVTNKFREVIVWTFFSSSAADGIPSRIYLVQAYESVEQLLGESVPFLLDSLHYSFLLGLTCLGIFVIFATDRMPTGRWRLVVLGFVPAAILYFPNPAWIPLEGLIPFNRWRLMVLPFLLLVPAAGFRYGMRPTKGAPVRRGISVFFMSALIFTTVTSGMTHPGLTDMAGIQKGSQQYLSEEELSASEFTFEHLDDQQTVYARSDLEVFLHQYAWAREIPHEREQFVKLRMSQSNREVIVNSGLTLVSVEAFQTEGIRMELTDLDSERYGDALVDVPVHANEYRWSRMNNSVVYSNGAVAIQHA